MECLWRLFCHWLKDGYCDQQDQAVFYVRLTPDNGFANYSLYDPGILAKYSQVHGCCKKKPLVLFIRKQKPGRHPSGLLLYVSCKSGRFINQITSFTSRFTLKYTLSSISTIARTIFLKSDPENEL